MRHPQRGTGYRNKRERERENLLSGQPVSVIHTSFPCAALLVAPTADQKLSVAFSIALGLAPSK